ncbi:MAG: ankyrin repeat domain-containing protein [bacterium]|nr:ankyrin repeat domain-containing protein [bacterium]
MNDGEYGYHEAWWERDAGSGWREVAGSRRSGKVCGFDLSSAPPGKYRMVLDATIAGARGVYKSRNEITKQPNTESQTEPERTTTTTEPSTTTPSCPPNTPTADWLSWGFWVSATTTQVQTQLRCEADIHAKDDDGWTPLHWAAAFSDDPAVIQALLAAGANPTMRSNSGETPLDVARDWENSAAVQVLSQAVALTDTSGNDAPRAPVVVANSGDPTRYEVRFVASFDARETRAYDFQFREKGTGDHWRVETCDTFENPESRPLSSVTAAIGVRGAEPATTYEVRYRYRNSSRCGQGTPGPWSQIGEGTTAMTS